METCTIGRSGKWLHDLMSVRSLNSSIEGPTRDTTKKDVDRKYPTLPLWRQKGHFKAFIGCFLRLCRAFPRIPRIHTPLLEVWLVRLVFLFLICLWRHAGDWNKLSRQCWNCSYQMLNIEDKQFVKMYSFFVTWLPDIILNLFSLLT